MTLPATGEPVQTAFVPDAGGPGGPGGPGVPPSAAAGAPIETQHVPDLPRFGRYRALARLGAGTTGVVYRAEDEALGRPVAIKVLHGGGDPALRERFLREARAFGAAPHANVLAIYDAGQGETPYLVMELAPAGSLRDRLAAGPLPVDATRRLGIQIARALAAAHAAGVVHRDVKPANLLAVEPDRWKLADFGIAHLPGSNLTVTGQFLGSPAYAAPEALRGGHAEPAADVYGLGATLYEALAGEPPRGHRDVSEILRDAGAAPPPPPLPPRLAVPRSIEGAILAALAPDPAARPSAEQLANLLAVVEDTAPVIAAAAAPATAVAPAAMPAAAAAPTTAAAAASSAVPRRALLVGAAIFAAVIAVALLAGGGSAPPAASGARDPWAPAAAPAWSPPEAPAAPEAPGAPEAPSAPEAPHAPYDDELDPRDHDDRPGPPGRGRGRGKWKKHKGR